MHNVTQERIVSLKKDLVDAVKERDEMKAELAKAVKAHSDSTQSAATREADLSKAQRGKEDAERQVHQLQEALKNSKSTASAIKDVQDELAACKAQAASTLTQHQQAIADLEKKAAEKSGHTAALEQELAQTKEKMKAVEEASKSAVDTDAVRLKKATEENEAGKVQLEEVKTELAKAYKDLEAARAKTGSEAGKAKSPTKNAGSDKHTDVKPTGAAAAAVAAPGGAEAAGTDATAPAVAKSAEAAKPSQPGEVKAAPKDAGTAASPEAKPAGQADTGKAAEGDKGDAKKPASAGSAKEASSGPDVTAPAAEASAPAAAK